MQAGERTRNWHVLSVARVLFFDPEMIEHLFAINLIEALHCRGGITKHTDMNRQNERGGRRKVPRTAPENDQSAHTGSPRRRKFPRTAPEKRSIQVVSGAGKSPGRRRKMISPQKQVVSGARKSPGRTVPESLQDGAGKSPGRRRKVTDFRR